MRLLLFLIIGVVLGSRIHQLAFRLCESETENKKVKIYSEMYGAILLVWLDNRFVFGTSHFYFMLFLILLLGCATIMDLYIFAFDVRIIYGLWVLALFKYQITFLESILCFIFFYLLLKLIDICLPNSLGKGDIDLFLVIAYIFGFYSTIWIILISSLIALPFAFKGKIAFVPFISLACVIVICLAL